MVKMSCAHTSILLGMREKTLKEHQWGWILMSRPHRNDFKIVLMGQCSLIISFQGLFSQFTIVWIFKENKISTIR